MTYNTLNDDGNAAAAPIAATAGHIPDEEIVTVATYQSIVEADLVRSELESRGISAFVSGATIAQTFISMPETGITIQVAAGDAAQAKQIADELSSTLPASFGDGDDEADDYSSDDTESDADLATPTDYGYEDVDEDAENAGERRAPESEVDIQRKPGMTQSQPMYDDAEAGG